ncbi:MAG: CBS domain-containing protein [Betaproteobacteria bacterium]|nr:CBS domain-containing protein [Betaproteobacteria bacterium]
MPLVRSKVRSRSPAARSRSNNNCSSDAMNDLGKGLAAGPFISEQEFLGIVEAAAQDAVIEHEERELIESVIEFGDTVVREIMVPRPDVVTINDDLTISQAIDIIVEHQLSRLPVLRADDDDQDDLVGVVYAKDLIAAERSGRGNESREPGCVR